MHVCHSLCVLRMKYPDFWQEAEPDYIALPQRFPWESWIIREKQPSNSRMPIILGRRRKEKEIKLLQ